MTLTAADVRNYRLPVRRWRTGYVASAVDDLLARAATSLEALASGRRADDRCTGDDVDSAEFRIGVWFARRYPCKQVDDFLDSVTDALYAAEARATGSEPARRSAAPPHVRKPLRLHVLQISALLLFLFGFFSLIDDDFVRDEVAFVALATGALGEVLAQLRVFAWERRVGIAERPPLRR